MGDVGEILITGNKIRLSMDWMQFVLSLFTPFYPALLWTGKRVVVYQQNQQLRKPT